MSGVAQEEVEQDLNDPGNEDPGSLMDDAEVPLIEEPKPGELDPQE